jgi:uncharacterized protein (TIGR01777 family)
MRIMLAGASGFLGSRLIPQLRRSGHEVVQLVRRSPEGPDQVRWDPGAGTLDRSVVSTVDAVVNLAGAGVADKRWSDEYKKILIESRVSTTGLLATAMAESPAGPKVLLNASGVDFYGDTGDRSVDEQSPPGEGFLADLTRAWEAATRPAEEAGARVVHLRTGMPLAGGGGLLKPLVLQFKLFAGGRMGSGRHYLPWISMPDWLGAVEFLLTRDDVSGPVNLCAPRPVTNAEFSAALGRVLHRPALVPVPRFALRLAAGELGAAVLESRRVVPGVLMRKGFEFAHQDVEEALRVALGAQQSASAVTQ